MSGNCQRTQGQQHLIESTEAMLDYAIIAGAELKNPMFVRLVRLARRALLGRDQPHPSPDIGAPTREHTP